MAVYTRINQNDLSLIEKDFKIGKIVSFSGIKKGIIIAPYEIFCPLNLYRAKAFAAKSAMVVLTTLATTPTLMLAQRALCKFVFDHISS